MKFLKVSIFVLICSCTSTRIQKQIHSMESEFQDHVGFLLYDPSTGKNLIDYNGDKYFTPASNTKIFTFYGALQVLGDSLPALYYQEKNDSLIIWGSGDPTLLYDYLPQASVFEFLTSSTKDIYFSDANFFDTAFGAGWAWDDYAYSFSSEKSSLPLYGNILSFKKGRLDKYPQVSPRVFKSRFFLADSSTAPSISRDYGSNDFYYRPSSTGELDTKYPFRYSGLLTSELLSDTLHRKVRYASVAIDREKSIIYNFQADSLYKELMQRSDNFIAEQLLLTISGVVSDTLNTEIAIKHVTDKYFQEMPDRPIWKDGSGLSRYNLFTPRSIVWLWRELLTLRSQDNLFSLLATGGESGTIKNYYKADESYIFGKTGTLSNNHVLSGYLRTRKGKILIFSLMNNNYPGYSSPVKKKMEELLWQVHLNY